VITLDSCGCYPRFYLRELAPVKLPAEHRAYVLRTQLVGPALFNAAVCTSFAWFFYSDYSFIPFWHPQGIAVDALISLFLIPSLTCLIGTPLIKLAIVHGPLSPLPWRRADHRWLGRLPESLLRRSLAFGRLGVIVGGPILLGVMAATGYPGLWLSYFLVFKAIYSALVAMIVAPIVAVCALADASSAT
jgi:hypothetical protein